MRTLHTHTQEDLGHLVGDCVFSTASHWKVCVIICILIIHVSQQRVCVQACVATCCGRMQNQDCNHYRNEFLLQEERGE